MLSQGKKATKNSISVITVNNFMRLVHNIDEPWYGIEHMYLF